MSSGAGAARSLARDEDLDAPGEAFVVKGTPLVAVRSVADGAHSEVIGVAPLGPLLPSSLTAAAYVEWSARLAGASVREARELSQGAFTRLGLRASAHKPTPPLGEAERRALKLASTIVIGPQVLVAEAPLRGLQRDSAAFVARPLDVSMTGRGAIVSVEAADLTSPSSLPPSCSRRARSTSCSGTRPSTCSRCAPTSTPSGRRARSARRGGRRPGGGG